MDVSAATSLLADAGTAATALGLATIAALGIMFAFKIARRALS